jgi:hypothetical protein
MVQLLHCIQVNYKLLRQKVATLYYFYVPLLYITYLIDSCRRL